ncbi:unnamed protein product [Symbiodinium natans]|uniref:Tyrosine-protein kinase ephrin type A/B receptor-like domain-containing protein n=1 Tax=Symbiodinium natans TaxID=878477 RepID=A0A812R964_9DINO|nr:unnamed protein product [Symbiodinium natans]
MPRPLLSCVLSISVAALAHATLEESCPPGLGSRSGILLQHKVAEIQSEELTEEPAPLKTWAELREDEGQGLDAKDSEALTLHDMLKPAGGKPQEAHMVPPTTVQNGHFELCHPQPGNALGQVSEGLNVSSSWNEVGGSCSNSEVVLFYPGETSAGFPGFSTSCCPADKEFCAGCSKLNSDKTGCEVCSGGFTLRSDKTCMACVDLPGWANKAGESCITASCTSEKYQGISAQDACCKCGGGQKEGTQFAYYVAPLAIGSTEVIGYPMPRTGSSLLTTGGA